MSEIKAGSALLGAVILASASAFSAPAGGGPVTQLPGSFTPCAFELDAPTGQVTMIGTVTCTMLAEAQFSGTSIDLMGKDAFGGPFNPEATGQEIVDSDSVLVECPGADAYTTNSTFVADAHRGYRPGPVQLYLDGIRHGA